MDTATAPAAKITITDPLDATKVDLNTFSLGIMSFAGQMVTPPPGLTDYTTDIDLRPANNLIVRVSGRLDSKTGIVTWMFSSLDPNTGLPTTDPTAGFLPPGAEGSVLFTCMPKKGTPTGTVIQNQAVIVFDANPAMSTPAWTNTIDADPPVSEILPVAAKQQQTSFDVLWDGTDAGSGIMDYTIYVSDNGGPVTTWLTDTTETQGTYPGVKGHTYTFWISARDNAGNVETPHSGNGATTLVVADTSPPVTALNLAGTAGTGGWFTGPVTVTLAAMDPDDMPAGSGSDVATIYYTLDGGAQQTYAGPFAVHADGSHTLTYWSVDHAGNTEATNARGIKIDSAAPVTTASAAGALVTLAAVDGTSGVAGTYYTIDGGAQQTYAAPVTVSANGAHTVAYWSVDKAGNTEAKKTLSLAVDTVRLATKVNLGGELEPSGWYTHAVRVSIDGTDARGGPGIAASYYILDGGAVKTYQGPFTLAADGIHSLTAWSADRAGNVNVPQVVSIKIDRTPPTLTCPANISVTRSAGQCTTKVSPGTATASDNLTTATVVGVRSDGLALTAPYPAGVTTITWTATDVAGNTSTCSQTVSVTPALAITSGLKAQEMCQGFATPVTLSVAAVTGGGTLHYAWTFNGKAAGGNSASLTVPGTAALAAGVYAVTVTVSDNCTSTTLASTLTVSDQCAGLFGMQTMNTVNFNGVAIPAGSTLWLTGVMNLKDAVSRPVTISVVNSVVSFTANNVRYVVRAPNSTITLSPALKKATLTFVNGAWNMAAPPNLAGDYFLNAAQLALPKGLVGGVKNVTWSAEFHSSVPGMTLNWQLEAAAYSKFNSSYSALGVKPVDDRTASAYANADAAGSPESYKQYLLPGGTGGGGTNYTGGPGAAATVLPLSP